MGVNCLHRGGMLFLHDAGEICVDVNINILLDSIYTGSIIALFQPLSYYIFLLYILRI